MAAIKLRKDGTVAIKLTNNLSFALGLLCTASLYEEGEHPDVRALLDALPARADLVDGKWGYGVSPGTRTVRLPVNLLPTLKTMLARTLLGGWPNANAPASRIEEIDNLPALQLLATAAD